MEVARSTRTVAGMGGVAIAAGVVSLLTDDVERWVFAALAVMIALLVVAMHYRPAAFFADVEPERPQRHANPRLELSPFPTTTFEWIVLVVLAAIAVVAVAALAGGPPTPALMVLGLAAYCYAAGRFGLRRGYNHRDRFLLLSGEVLAGAGLLGLALQLVVP